MISVVVLIALIIIAIVSAALLKVAMTRRASTQAEERRIQAGLLADSGLERAASRLEASPEFTGETWEIPAQELGDRGRGVVTIVVEPIADRPRFRKVRVQADFPAESQLRARVTREAILPIPPAPR
jgi:type II secretory pathway pseudopilin PulG